MGDDHDADGISRTIDNDSYDTERDTDGQLRQQHRQYGSRCRPLEPIASGWGPQAQVEDPCARPALLLHGRQVPWLLHHHHRLLPRPDRRRVRRLLSGPLPADRWQGQTHRGLLFPEKVDDSLRATSGHGGGKGRSVRYDEMRRDGNTVEPLGHGMKINVWRAGSGPKEEMYAVVQHGASWQSTSGVRSVDTHRKGEVCGIFRRARQAICFGVRIPDKPHHRGVLPCSWDP